MHLATWLETLLQDLRHALRVWRKRPLIALTAILTIALGAGMNVAVFEVIWNAMLKPLPYADSSRLVQVWMSDGREERNAPRNTLIEQWREGSQMFTHLASYRPWRVTVASGGDPEQVFAAVVSPEFFETLGAPLLAGRAFLPEESREGADNVVLLREGYWRNRFDADSAMVGREITIDSMLSRVIGIVPDSFRAAALIEGVLLGSRDRRGAGSEPDIYLPLSRARVAGMRAPVSTSYVIGRLHAAATAADATAELASITANDSTAANNSSANEQTRRVWVSPLQAEIGHEIRPALFALAAATGCVLLIACANLANLLLSQAVLRRRELAVRAALGAGRARVVRQLLTEAAVLSLTGAAAGLAAAQMILQVVTALYPDAIPRSSEGGPPPAVHALALGVTLLCAMIFGVLPAWRATGEANDEALRVGSLWMSRGSRRWADGMVAVQLGLTAVVLIAAGLLLKSFVVLRDVDLGFARQHLITSTVNLPAAHYETRDDRARFGAEWLERLNAIPGVSAAAISNSLPLRYTLLLNVTVRVPGESKEQIVGGRAVGGAYFEAMGIEWVAGGPFDEASEDQVVVNEAFVQRHLQGGAAVGINLGAGDKPLTITGVVKDVRHLGMREAASPEMFMPFARFPLNPVDTVVRSQLPPGQVAAAMRRQLQSVDPQLALGEIKMMSEVIDDQLARPRFQALLLALFAAAAMALAAVGAYGVIAHNVRSRVAEFGLRRALGAGTPELVRLVLWDGMKAPLLGLAVGLAIGAFAVGRYLETLLYGITPRDPAVLLLTGGLLALTALLACALPGRWAASVEPSQALRQE
jgi:putative ABC transport system permease protein